MKPITKKTLIINCDLAIRIKTLFAKAEFKTVEDIIKYPLLDLVKYKGFGKKSYSEVKWFLVKNNFKFKK